MRLVVKVVIELGHLHRIDLLHEWLGRRFACTVDEFGLLLPADPLGDHAVGQLYKSIEIHDVSIGVKLTLRIDSG